MFIEFLLYDFRVYLVIKIVWYWCYGSYVDFWNRIKNLEVGLYIYGKLIFNKYEKEI